MPSDQAFSVLILYRDRMYPQRIKDWGLDKNNKDKEMRAIVRNVADRAAHGKVSKIRVRGRSCDYQDVVRYWKRKKMLVDDILARRSMSKTPDDVKVCTPLLSPIRTPEVLAIPERILVMLRDYHRGSFDAGTWRSVGEHRLCETTKVTEDGSNAICELHSRIIYACALFNEDFSKEAGQFLNRAFRIIRGIVFTEGPETFQQLLRILSDTSRRGRTEIELAVIRYFSSMGGVLLGDQHPFKLICGWLASLDLADQGHDMAMLRRSIEVIYEAFKESLGPLHFTLISSFLDTFKLGLWGKNDTGSQNLAFQTLLHECEDVLGPDDDRTLEVRLTMAYYYRDRCEYFAAIEQAQALVAQNTSILYHIRGLKEIARSRYHLQEIHPAFRALAQGIDKAIDEWGAGDSETQRMMLELENLMADQGMPEAAAQMGVERLRGLECRRLRDPTNDVGAGKFGGGSGHAGGCCSNGSSETQRIRLQSQ